MNKEQFNNLNIEEQVKYINTELQITSLTKVCDSIGIDRATVRKRFKSNGYILIDNQYKATEESTTKESREPKKSKIDTTNTVATKGNKKDSKGNKEAKDIKVLSDRIEVLEGQINDLYNVINTINTTNTHTINTVDTRISKYQGEKESCNFRVDKEVRAQFKKYCKANSDFSVADIVTSALDYFIKNNK